ncbi:unnamed protein product [Scytosiphon promiscuus]
MADARASRVRFAVLAVFATGAVRASITDTCCDAPDASVCCPKPSIVDDAANLSLTDDRKLRIVNDPARCCSDSSEAAVGCTAYGVAGCSFCRDVCDKYDDSCVLCSIADSLAATAVAQTPTPKAGEEVDSKQDAADDLWEMFEDADHGSEDEIALNQTPGSYDFSDDPEQYDCSACSWDRMSNLEQRLLTQRSRSMVCDSSCLHNSGDADYGVTLCNYFNSGRGCRACCHEGYMVDGCMPCEGEGSCDSCISNIKQICKEEPCEPECQAYVCCSVRWGEYSGCEETMHHEMAELAEKVSDHCKTLLTCDDISLTCSDNARTCAARSTSTNRRMQEETYGRCRTLSVTGAGKFNSKYASTGSFGDELIFRTVGARHHALQSVAIDACTGMDHIPFIDATSAGIIVARSGSGFLAWDDGTDPHPHVTNTGVGCPRHMWFLHDTTRAHENVVVTVDRSEHPQFISSDWVNVGADGKITRIDLDLSCVKGKQDHVIF